MPILIFFGTIELVGRPTNDMHTVDHYILKEERKNIKLEQFYLKNCGFWVFLVTQSIVLITREVSLRKNIVAVSFFQNCAIHPYS